LRLVAVLFLTSGHDQTMLGKVSAMTLDERLPTDQREQAAGSDLGRGRHRSFRWSSVRKRRFRRSVEPELYGSIGA